MVDNEADYMALVTDEPYSRPQATIVAFGRSTRDPLNQFSRARPRGWSLLHLSRTFVNSKVTPGACLLRSEATIIGWQQIRQHLMSHRRAKYAAVGHYSCLWAEPMRSSESILPVKIGSMVTVFNRNYCMGDHLANNEWGLDFITI